MAIRLASSLLGALGLCLLLPSTALAGGDDWADEDYDGDRDRRGHEDPAVKEKLGHIRRADSLAKGPTIPLMAAGLYLGGPVALAFSGFGASSPLGLGASYGSVGFQFSNVSGVLLASSLGTSITGAFIANGVAGSDAEWGLLVTGMAVSVSGFVVFQVGVQSVVSPTSPFAGAGVTAPTVAAVVAGASCVIVGEILTMASSGAVESRYEDMVSEGRRRPRPSVALYAMPLEGGLSAGLGGRF